MTCDLAVLVNGFPRLSETFVLQELLDLERRGVRLHVFALQDPGEAVQQEAIAELNAEVEYVEEPTTIGRLRLARLRSELLRARGLDFVVAQARLAAEREPSSKSVRRGTALAARLVELGSPPLYIHFAHKPGTIGRIAAKLAGVPYALSCHAKDIWANEPLALRRKLRDAEVVMTCTSAGQVELERHASGTPVLLIHHGCDVEAVAAQRPVDGPPRILTVGRLVEKKGHDNLIHAAALLRESGLDFRLRIVGDGIEWAKLQRLVHRLGLGGHVWFLGPLSPAELEPEWGSASVFALGCRQLANGDRDGLPNVVMEAMVNGLPVVASEQDGIAEAVTDGRSGLLVAPDNPAALAAALKRVLTEPGLATQLGEGARQDVRARFDRRELLPAVAEALRRAAIVAFPPVSASEGSAPEGSAPERSTPGGSAPEAAAVEEAAVEETV